MESTGGMPYGNRSDHPATRCVGTGETSTLISSIVQVQEFLSHCTLVNFDNLLNLLSSIQVYKLFATMSRALGGNLQI
jgi:hypothetical protein